MPNMIKPNYSSQMGAFMDEPEIAAQIKAWASHLNITHGQVMRDIVRAGLPLVAQDYAERSGGQPPQRSYEAILRAEKRKGAERARRAAQAKRAARKAAA